MPDQVVTIIGFAAAAIATGVAFYFWRKSQGLYSLLVEGANRFEEVRQRTRQLESELDKSREQAKQQRETVKRLEESIDEARQKSNELMKKLEAKEHEVQLVTEKLELQKGHLQKQLTKVESQLRASEVSRQALEERMEQISGATEKKLEDMRSDLTAKLEKARSKLKEMEKERHRLEKKVSEADPVEMRKLKRRIAQHERLYNSMKGLREMAEERNQNWEVALRKLSTWIVEQKTGRMLEPDAPIGPVVAAALQTVGTQLIEDSETLEGQYEHVGREAGKSDGPKPAATSQSGDVTDAQNPQDELNDEPAPLPSLSGTSVVLSSPKEEGP